MLQARQLVQKHMRAADTKGLNAKGLVKSLEHVANNFASMSTDEVNEALAAAAEALATLSPAIQKQVGFLQDTVNHAVAAVEACHGDAGVVQRAGLWEQAEAQAVISATCEAELATAVADEAQICSAVSVADVQSECACNEATARREDKEELCATILTGYEFAYCEHNLQCNTYHGCHQTETAVYNQVRGDVDAEMVPVEEEYIKSEQATCILDLVRAGMAANAIDNVAIAACSAVDTSSLLLVHPDLPAAPEACPAATTGVQLINNWNFEEMTIDGAAGTLAEGRYIHFLNDGNSGLTNTAIPGWHQMGSQSRAAGLYNSASNEIAAEGSHVLFLNTGNDDNYVYQDLLEPFTKTINIEAAVGGGNGVADGGYRFGLYSQDGTLLQEVAANVNGAPDTMDTQYTLTHLSVSPGDHPAFVGQNLQLRLMKNKGQQGHYHYIRVTALPCSGSSTPPLQEGRYIFFAGMHIYWEVSGVKHWVGGGCSMCNDVLPVEHRPCAGNWANVEQSYIDSLQNGPHFQCSQHPLSVN